MYHPAVQRDVTFHRSNSEFHVRLMSNNELRLGSTTVYGRTPLVPKGLTRMIEGSVVAETQVRAVRMYDHQALIGILIYRILTKLC